MLSSEKKIEELLDDCEILYISDPSVLQAEAEKAAELSEVVVACGGDGTIQSIARGLYGTDAKMGVIPIGSGNDFAKSVGLKLKQSMEYYLGIIKNNGVKNIDVPTINNRIFINTVGIGFDGLTNYYASQFTGLTGIARYTIAGIKAFFAAKPFAIKGAVDRKSLHQKVWLVAIANGATEGGKYTISPESLNDDGKLELVIVPAYSRLKLGLAFIMLSLRKPLSNSYSTIIPFKTAKISLEANQHIHLDGEVGVSANTYVVKLKTEKLKVISNQQVFRSHKNWQSH